jgi:hypothetical protein
VKDLRLIWENIFFIEDDGDFFVRSDFIKLEGRKDFVHIWAQGTCFMMLGIPIQ